MVSQRGIPGAAGIRVKSLVAILVVVVQAVGPWLCCGLPARSVAHACSHCQVGPKKVANPSCCDAASRPQPKPSDCCQHCCQPMEPVPAIPSLLVSLPNLFETPGEFVTLADMGLGSLATALATSGEHPPPFLSVEEKLFTHHVLRC